MAWRTTAEAVKAILLDNYDGSANLNEVIDIANVLTTEVSTCASTRGVTMSAALLTKIEGFLAAHFYGHGDQFFQQKQTEKARATFQGETGKGLESTQYGQAAITMDISGCLAAFDKGSRATMAWGGKAPSDQTLYGDRD